MFARMLSLAGSALGRGKLSILIYHQVLPEFDPMRPDEPIESSFTRQMSWIARYFTPLSLEDALSRMEQGNLPANAVCVTFDDGYRNNLTVAQPILEKYDIPATVFVATGFSGGANMWNDRILYLCGNPDHSRLHIEDEQVELGDWTSRRALAQQLINRLKYLSVDERSSAIDTMYEGNALLEQPRLMMDRQEIQSLYGTGVGIGAHTVNHPILLGLPEGHQRKEIVRSRETLQEWTQSPVAHFAYPNGKFGVDYDAVAVNILRNEGFTAAVSTDWGVSTSDTSRLQLRRFTPWDQTQLRFQGRLLWNAVRS